MNKSPLQKSLAAIELLMQPLNTGLSVSTVKSNFDTLKEGVEQDQFIVDFESFWFEKNTITALIQSLITATNRLAALGPQLTSGLPTADHLNVISDVQNQWKLILADIYSLTEVLEKSGILTQTARQTSYPELHFARNTRSSFYQHPSVEIGYENMGVQVNWFGQNNLLPVANFGPRSGGFPFYFEYHQTKSGHGPSTFEKILPLNRELLLHKRWDGMTDAERSQIKGWGMPLINEERLAGDLQKLFEDAVVPDFRAKLTTAQTRGVV